jgi:2,3-dihydroxybiphenyl 1,2-dioxygenase
MPERLYGLGYVGFRSPDLDAWARFGRDILGGEVSEPASSGDALLIRLDDRAFRLTISEGENGYDCAGWEVAGYREFDQLLEQLGNAGVAIKEQPELAAGRRVARLATCVDPAGNNVEFFCGALQPKAPLVAARSSIRYVTGQLGLGHVVFTVPDLEATKRFYLDLLGFKISDIIGVTHFCRTNRRHHSLAFRELEGPSRFRHFSLQVEDLDMVGRTLDLAERSDVPVANGLGRHTNDLMVSFYLKTPSGHEVEYGCYGREVDEQTWSSPSYDAVSQWGHKRTIPID